MVQIAYKGLELMEAGLCQNRLDMIAGDKRMWTNEIEDEHWRLVQQRREDKKVSLSCEDLTLQLQKKLQEYCKLEYSFECTEEMQTEAPLHARNLYFVESEWKMVDPREEAEANRRNEKIIDRLKGCHLVEHCNWRQDNFPEKKFLNVWVPYIDSRELMKEIKVIEVLGVGGNGTAELVLHRGRLCVLKTAIRGRIDAIELQIMSYLDGVGGAPQLLAAAEDRFLCSFVGHQSLDDLMNNETLSQDILLRAVRKVAERVCEIHWKSISHNDIKANNIMYDTTTGDFNIIDFGLSCRMGEALFAIRDPGEYARINWQAPEVKRGQTITDKSDVFSLGVLLRLLLFLFVSPDETALSLAGQATSEAPSDRPNLEEFINALKWAEEATVFRMKAMKSFGFGNTNRNITNDVVHVFGNSNRNITNDVIHNYGSMNGLVTYSFKTIVNEYKTQLESQDWIIPNNVAEDWIEDWENYVPWDDWGKF